MLKHGRQRVLQVSAVGWRHSLHYYYYYYYRLMRVIVEVTAVAAPGSRLSAYKCIMKVQNNPVHP